MSTIHYVQGDATCPQAAGTKIICHILSDRAAWGKGFVLAISKRWKEPEKQFRAWYKQRAENDFALGAVQFVHVQPDIWIANMVGQHGLKSSRQHVPPIRYEATAAALHKVAAKARELSASVHMPRIGCGLAGGTWEKIEPLIQESLVAAGIAVTVYDYS